MIESRRNVDRLSAHCLSINGSKEILSQFIVDSIVVVNLSVAICCLLQDVVTLRKIRHGLQLCLHIFLHSIRRSYSEHDNI